MGVTIGSFDGFHLGHQALMQRTLLEVKRIAGLSSTVSTTPTLAHSLLTFEPHPRLFFARTKATSSLFLPLMTAREKVEYVRESGFEFFIAQRFNEAIARLSPEEFVERHIVRDLRANVVVIGYDWAFGKGRGGTPELLKDLGKRWGFEVVVVDAVLGDGEKISSSRVRDCLARGEMEQVQRLLSRNYSLMGRVVHGDKRGRTIGFPTANLLPQRKQLPPRGVYATLLHCGADGQSKPSVHQAVTNIGIRPTFDGSRMVVETHILKGDFELYSQLVKIEFLSRIRAEQKFPDKESLVAQIAKDCRFASDYHAQHESR